jgi:hypothetical protein
MDANTGKGDAKDFDPNDQCQHRHCRLMLAPPTESFSCDEAYMENINGVQAKLQPVTESTSDHSEASEYDSLWLWARKQRRCRGAHQSTNREGNHRRCKVVYGLLGG